MRTHIPNQIPAGTRVWYAFLSLLLLIYGAVGLYFDDLYLPGKRSRGVHLHGEPAWIMYAAFLCAAANLISVIIDHYDRRDNEHDYRTFAKVAQIAGWVLFALALVLDLTLFHQGTR